MNTTIPRLAMINDIAGFGRCSTTVSLPIISCLQVQVCPVPSAILSNHLAFPHYYKQDYTPYMRDYLSAWEKIEITFDGLYTGFLGDVEQIQIVEDFLKHFQPKLFLLDPVMGDHGKLYSGYDMDYCERMKSLLKRAQIITPNLTEACLLTHTPYHESNWSESQLTSLCLKLSTLCSGKIIITGIQQDENFINCIFQDHTLTLLPTKSAGASRPGTGDIFASIIIAEALYNRDIISSINKAADFIATCIEGSNKAGIPIHEGVIFEKYLHKLYG